MAAVVVIVLAAALSVWAVQRRHPTLPLGRPAPALCDPVAGVDLAALRGRPVLVEFFASWCPPCARIAAPAVAAVAEAHAGDGLTLIGVALERPETRADLPPFLARHHIDWPVSILPLGFDDPALAPWRVRSIPALFLVAPDGTIAAEDLIGSSVEESRDRIERALAALSPTGHASPGTGLQAKPPASPAASSATSPDSSPPDGRTR